MIKKCEKCGVERNTNGKAALCAKCEILRRRETQNEEWKIQFDSLGYDIVEFNIIQGSHSKVTVTNRECGHTFSAQVNNLITRCTVCGVCGKTKRMNHALKFYVEKYGRTYDLKKWRHYCDYVRILSEKVYRENKATMNPNNFPRTTPNRHPHAVNLDHIIPIIYGFKNGLEPEVLADVRNLRVVPARKNLSKKQVLTEEAKVLCGILM